MSFDFTCAGFTAEALLLWFGEESFDEGFDGGGGGGEVFVGGLRVELGVGVKDIAESEVSGCGLEWRCAILITGESAFVLDHLCKRTKRHSSRSNINKKKEEDTYYHLINKNTKTPPVHCTCVSAFLHNLGRNILLSAHEGRGSNMTCALPGINKVLL